MSSTVQSLCPVAQFFPAGIVTTQSWPEREKFGILTQICFAGLSVSLLIFQHWAQHLSNIRLAILYNYLTDYRHMQSSANSWEPVILSSRTFLEAHASLEVGMSVTESVRDTLEVPTMFLPIFQNLLVLTSS